MGRWTVAALGGYALLFVLVLEQRLTSQQLHGVVTNLQEQNGQLQQQLSSALPREQNSQLQQPAAPPAPALLSPDRRLASIYTLGTAATSGCYEVTGGDGVTLDLSSATCSGTAKCPSCFFASSISADLTLTLSSCSSAIVGANGGTYSGIREYLVINGDSADTVTVTDGTNSFLLGPMNMVWAACYSSGSDKLYFQSNYGVAGSNVATCPDGCDSATPFKASDSTTAFTLVPALTADQKTRVGYLTDADVGGNVVWGGTSVGFTADQTTRVGYLTNADVGGNVVWGGAAVGFTTAKAGYLDDLATADPATGALSYITVTDPATAGDDLGTCTGTIKAICDAR